MKRNSSINSFQELPILPREILPLISNQIWHQSVKLNQLLNWHSTCKLFWDEYQSYDDEKMLAFIAKKKEKNYSLFQKKFHSQYNSNLIEFTQYETIILICTHVKRRITLLDSTYLDKYKIVSTNMNFEICDWNTWKGMNFEENSTLREDSLSLLKAVTPRLQDRYGWRLTFQTKSPDKQKKVFLTYPWDEQPIKSEYNCFFEAI